MRTTNRVAIGICWATSVLITLPFAAACEDFDGTHASKNQQAAKGMRGSEGMKGQAGAAGSSAGAPDEESGSAKLTTFTDGPTGYVFVYTTEGWKFVGGAKK